MRKPVHLDCEFVRDDLTPEGLISIGIAMEGLSYYAVNAGMDVRKARERQWMVDNVWPHLPMNGHGGLDFRFSDVKTYEQIRDEISHFFARVCTDARKELRMVVDHGAQDVIRLHALWNHDWDLMPKWIPRHADDMASIEDDSGLNPAKFPMQDPATVHHALFDAKHSYRVHEHIRLQLAGM